MVSYKYADEASDDDAEASSTLDEADLFVMTVPQLKKKLREAGLPVSGKKAEPIERAKET